MTVRTFKNISNAILTAKNEGKFKVSATYEVEILLDTVSSFITIYKYGKKISDLFVTCDEYGCYSVLDGDTTFEKFLNA